MAMRCKARRDASSFLSGSSGTSPLANRCRHRREEPEAGIRECRSGPASKIGIRSGNSFHRSHRSEPPRSAQDTRIGAGCVVGRNVKIGAGCVLYPRVVVYPNVEIGNNVIIHAGAVIGADGFGFVKDGDRYVQFPQIGAVIIEDDVEIGANTCIDRGSLETTVIRRGTKIDNLVQIAHNVEVGEHTVIAAQTGISGSSTVGPHSILAGQVGIGEHARLDAHTILGGQAGVLNGKHVRGGEILWGTPARPLKEFLEQQAHLARLPKWIKEIKHRLGIRGKSDS